MHEKNLTPEDSLLLITKTIEETRQKFEENGHIIILWGVLIFTVFASQYILVLLNLHKVFDIIWTVVLFPLGAIYTFIFVRKNVNRRKLPKTIITRVLESMGWTLGANLMILSLIFSRQLGIAHAPILIILLAFSIIVIGASIKFRPIFIGGVLMNLIGLGTFFLERDYHGFSLMLGAVVGLIIPGILLNKARRKEDV